MKRKNNPFIIAKHGEAHNGMKGSSAPESPFAPAVNDITETKRLEKEVQSLNFFKTLSDSLLDGFGIYSSIRNEAGQIVDFHIEFVNQAACELIQLSFADQVGKTILELFPSFGTSQLFASACKVVDTGKPVITEFVNYADKTETIIRNCFEIKMVKLEDGIAASWHDKTKQRIMETDLRINEEMYSNYFDYNPLPMSVINLKDLRIKHVNKKWQELTGYKAEEVLGKHLSELNIFPNPDGAVATIRNALISLKPLRNLKWTQISRDGALQVGWLTVDVIMVNQEPSLLTVFLDYTERKQMEINMARLNSITTMGEIAASLGHELRNPITAVRGLLQMMRNNETYLRDRDFFDLMLDELDRASSIIMELLALARQKELDVDCININDLLKSIYPLLEANAAISDQKVVVDLSPVPNLILDVKEFKQLVLNLALNGLEAMPPEGTLTIQTNLVNGHVVLSVHDTGPGISPELIPKLGKPFVTNKENGTGLGLAVCYQIAARHNATINFDTGPNGTSFYVSFELGQTSTF